MVNFLRLNAAANFSRPMSGENGRYEKMLVSVQLPAAAAQEAAEGFPEGDVAQSVAAGVDGAVDVAEPVSHGPQDAGDLGLVEGGDEGQDVVRRPGEDEGQDDGQDGLGDPPLPRHDPAPPPLQRLEAGARRKSVTHRPVVVPVGQRVVLHAVVVFNPGVPGAGRQRRANICQL